MDPTWKILGAGFGGLIMVGMGLLTLMSNWSHELESRQEAAIAAQREVQRQDRDRILERVNRLDDTISARFTVAEQHRSAMERHLLILACQSGNVKICPAVTSKIPGWKEADPPLAGGWAK